VIVITWLFTGRQHSLLCRCSVLAVAKTSVRLFVSVCLLGAYTMLFYQNDSSWNQKIFPVISTKGL